MSWGALAKPFQCVQAAQADRGLWVAKLFNGLGVELSDAPFNGVVFSLLGGPLAVVLATKRQQHRDRGTRASPRS
ncbi:hypothetical protein [Streptomyces afghaniensis]|uniref:hypothetical protein n=1 Tax=Streptomyces afghaniensis TaxID=66865 RepID=UPI00378DD6C5